LIVATDGFNECFNLKGEMFGNERLLQAVNELAHFPASQIGGELFQAIASFAEGTSQSDDRTLVVIKKVS
jgi:serine phosphatase RsbU (regulator of sigma subunit)